MQHRLNGMYLTLYSACRKMLEDVRPAVVVVDTVCAPEIDACRHNDFGHKLMILSPMGLKDLLIPVQPWACVFMEVPCVCKQIISRKMLTGLSECHRGTHILC
jgi:hypothetical protein